MAGIDVFLGGKTRWRVVGYIVCVAAFAAAAGRPSGAVAQEIPIERSDVAESGDPQKLEVDLPRPYSEAWKRFSDLELWEDGLSEMCYYDAECVIYGKKRKMTRVHLMNRQVMDERRWVKADEDTTYELPAFKTVISEEVPTENYNYRFLITAFVERPSLEPIKVTVSSQEWCGTTYKSLLWSRFQEIAPSDWSLDLCSFSYFPGEEDVWTPLPASVDAYECLYLFARAVVASGGESRQMRLLRSMRSNRAADPVPLDAVLKVEGDPRRIKVPRGKFEAQRVVVEWEGDETWFDIQTEAPWRLLAYRAGDVAGELRFVERRAYWDRDSKSGFHKQGHAP